MKNRKVVIAAAVLAAVLAVAVAGSRDLRMKLFGRKGSAAPSATQEAQGTAGTVHQHQAAPPSETPQPQERETPTIEIPEDKQQMLGVKIAEAAVRPLQKVIRTVGLIEYDERKLATVNTKFEGWIEKLFVDFAGKYVKKGEPLAEIYSPELLATQKEFLNALNWARKSAAAGSGSSGSSGQVREMLTGDARTIIEAARQRLKLWDISDAQIRKIEETGEPIRTLTLYSPVSGYVVQKMALQGMRVMPGEKLFDVADLSTLWVVADVYESELALVKPGEHATIGLSYFPDKEFSSRIDFIYPSISSTTRAAKVRFSIPNQGGKLKPQMYTNITIKVDLGKKLAIPEDAVLDTGTRQVVYVDRGEGNFEPREILTGLRSEGFREVVSGLKVGEKVAASAAFLIDSEAQLKNVTPLPGPKKAPAK